MSTKTPTRFEFRTPRSTRTPTTGVRNTKLLSSTGSTRRRCVPRTPGDRFIPSRATTDMEFARFKVNNQLVDENSPPQKVKGEEMLDKLLDLKGVCTSSSTMSFGQTTPSSSKGTPGRCKWIYIIQLPWACSAGTLNLCILFFSFSSNYR